MYSMLGGLIGSLSLVSILCRHGVKDRGVLSGHFVSWLLYCIFLIFCGYAWQSQLVKLVDMHAFMGMFLQADNILLSFSLLALPIILFSQGFNFSVYALIFLSIGGAWSALNSVNYIDLMVNLELMINPLYIIAMGKGLGNVDTGKNLILATLKYFIMNSWVFAVGLFGVSLVILDNSSLLIGCMHTGYLGYLGKVLFVFALIFKLGVAPFHLPFIDLYSISLPSANLFVMFLPKLVCVGTLGNILAFDLEIFWILSVGFGLLGMWVGALGAARANNLMQFLSYSSVFNFSLLLFNLQNCGWFLLCYSINFTALMYLINYFNLNFSNLSILSVRVRVLLSFWIFSLMGLPPFLGFVAKVHILLALAGNFFLLLGVLFLNLLGTYYPFRFILKVFKNPVSASVAPLSLDFIIINVMLIAMQTLVGYLAFLNLNIT